MGDPARAHIRRTAGLRATLGGVQALLEGRALIRRVDDPVLPWVRRMSESIFEAMKAQASRDPAWMERAQAEWEQLMQELDAQFIEWQAEGHEDYVRRASLVTSKRSPW
jgi:hypothetical protein